MNDFSEHIVKEIQTRGVVPRPRWQFSTMRGVFWLLATISVLVGGCAFAVASFVFFDNDGLSITTLEQSSIYDLAQSIPFIWIFILGLFTTSAFFWLRQTRKGYRYATSLVVVSTIVASIMLGLALNTVDFGQRLHQYLLDHTSFYDALIHSRSDLQQ